MAKTPAAQAFGELGNGEWRGMMTEHGQVVVPPALVRAKYKRIPGEIGEDVEYFLLCSISTHYEKSTTNRIHLMFNGVWCISATSIDAYRLDPNELVKNKGITGVFYLDVEWADTLSRGEIFFEPSEFAVLPDPEQELSAPPNLPTLAGIVRRARTKGYVAPIAIDPPSWATIRMHIEANYEEHKTLLHPDLDPMPYDIFGPDTSAYPSVTYNSGQMVRAGDGRQGKILRSGADFRYGYTHAFMYKLGGEDETKYAYARTDGQLALGGVVAAYAAFTPEMLRDRVELLDKALKIDPAEWYRRPIGTFARELILSSEEVEVPLENITNTILAVDPIYLIYLDGGSISTDNIFLQMLALGADGKLLRCPTPSRATVGAVLRRELCVGVDGGATRQLIQRELERQSALKDNNLQCVSLKLPNFSAAQMLSLNDNYFDRLRWRFDRALTYEINFDSVSDFRDGIVTSLWTVSDETPTGRKRRSPPGKFAMLVDDHTGHGPRLRWCLETKILEIACSIAMFSAGATHRLASAKLPDPPSPSQRAFPTQALKFCVVAGAWVPADAPDPTYGAVKAKFARCKWPWWGDAAMADAGKVQAEGDSESDAESTADSELDSAADGAESGGESCNRSESESGGAGEIRIVAIKRHKVYNGAQAGALYNVYVSVEFADGTSSGRDYYPSEPLWGHTVGREIVRKYAGTAQGQRGFAKYVPATG